MMKWFKSLKRQEKVMIIMIILLLVFIILRWGWIKKEIGDSFRNRIERLSE